MASRYSFWLSFSWCIWTRFLVDISVGSRKRQTFGDGVKWTEHQFHHQVTWRRCFGVLPKPFEWKTRLSVKALLFRQRQHQQVSGGHRKRTKYADANLRHTKRMWETSARSTAKDQHFYRRTPSETVAAVRANRWPTIDVVALWNAANVCREWKQLVTGPTERNKTKKETLPARPACKPQDCGDWWFGDLSVFHRPSGDHAGAGGFWCGSSIKWKW